MSSVVSIGTRMASKPLALQAPTGGLAAPIAAAGRLA